MKKRRRRILEEAPINLTPLIDVVFVILIMFIVVAPLLQKERVELAAHASALKQPSSQEHDLIIHVFSDDTINFNQQPVEFEQLEKLLVQAKVKYPKSHPQLFHDKKATFGTYQSIKNIVEAAGFCEMDVLLKPQ